MTHIIVLQQASIMESYGLKGLVINSDTIHAAQLRGEDIWKMAETEPSMVFLAPEQLTSPGFNDLSKDDSILLREMTAWRPLEGRVAFVASCIKRRSTI
jgi:hypothetical protein